MNAQKRIEPRKLKGFRDYLPAVCQTRYEILDQARAVAKRFGFQMVATPSLEYAEVLLGQGSDEIDKEVYRFDDHGGRSVALRFDLTVPFARFVAENQNDLAFPFKRMQIGEVWRGEKPQKGRYREFCQCDIDIIGEDSVLADSEALLCIRSILSELNIGPFTMRLGNRPVLAGLIHAALPQLAENQANGGAGLNAALVWIDKVAKIGVDATVAGLAGLQGATEAGARLLLDTVFPAPGEARSDLAKVRRVLSEGSSVSLAALDRFEELVTRVNKAAPGLCGKAVADLSIARGLGYYTGVVYETFLDALSGFGSISSGGRYDDLASRFCNRHLPGVGGSLGVDRLLAALEELGRIGVPTADTVFLAIASDDAQEFTQKLAMDLRLQGFAVDMALKAGKVGNQFKFADRMGFPFVVTIGGSEVAAGAASIKNMKTGQEEKSVRFEDLPARLRSLLKS